MINLYNAKFTKTSDFNNNGFGSLKDTTKCEVTEELNGECTIDFEYPKNGKYAPEIENEMIIKVDTGEEKRQLFRVKNRSENMTMITAKPQHITYDLRDNALDDVFPQNQNGAGAIDWILTHTQYNHLFKGYSDITNQASARYVRKNPLEAIIGDLDNSFVNVWGGELQRDNFNVKMLKQRGEDKGYTIKYGKNLTGIEFSKNGSNVITRLRPIGYNGLLLPEKYIDSPLIEEYPHPKIGEIEYSDIKLKEEGDEEGFDTLEQCYEEMRNRAAKEFSENNIDKPKINVKVDFVDLSQTTEYSKYKILNSVKLGDTVTIILGRMKIKVRVIRTVYDSLTHRFISLELGEFKANYVSDSQKTIAKTVKKETAEISNDILSNAKQNATDLILKATRGYVCIRPVENPQEILIMDTPNPNTATKIWRWNMNGFAYSSSGINGPYGTAITMDGSIVADFISAGILSANLIKAGSMSLSRLYGDVLTLGGNANKSGKLEIKDANANLMVLLDNNGVSLSNGARLIGGNGVLSCFQFVVKNPDAFLGFKWDMEQYIKDGLRIEAHIPANFVITSAKITLIHNPIHWENDGQYFWGYAQNIRLYKVTNQNSVLEAPALGGCLSVASFTQKTEVTSAFPGGYFTAKNPETNNHVSEVIETIDIKNWLNASGRTTFIVETAEAILSAGTIDNPNFAGLKKTGTAEAVLNVIGYMK